MNDKVFSRICECYICEKEELTNQTILPAGWISFWEFPYDMCDECLAKWVAKWGSEPGYLYKGGEKELTLV